MSWLLGGVYCAFLWLVFARLRLLKLSLPLAVICGSVGPSLILALLFCAQYYHPFTSNARVFKRTVPIVPQLSRPGRVTQVVVAANQAVKQGDVLFKVDAVPYQNSVSRLTTAVEEAQQNQDVAKSSVELAEASLKRAVANLDFATADRDRKQGLVTSNAISAQEYELAVTRYAEANAAVAQVEASLTQARLGVGLAAKKIEQAETQLADAQYDLSQTTVVAPGDGYVTNMQLTDGMLVGGSAGAVMSFVLESDEQNQGVVVAAFNQKNYLRIKKGQYCEVALLGYPGQIFKARVLNSIDISGAGQLQASGVLPSDLGPRGPAEFAVRIQLEDKTVRLPGGSQAQVAVYTENVQIAGIPVMFIIRAQSWLRYVM